MADRPILFSGPMVRAIIEGRKTQTRRVLKPQPFPAGYFEGEVSATRCRDDSNDPRVAYRFNAVAVGGGAVLEDVVTSPYAVGDRLWVRETHYVWSAGYKDGSGRRISYRASEPDAPTGWTVSSHMPRWASRLTLIIEGVKVERLNDISEEDAKAEGVNPLIPPPGVENPHRYSAAFMQLWGRLHGDGATYANPWIVAVTFRPILSNIDHIDRAAA